RQDGGEPPQHRVSHESVSRIRSAARGSALGPAPAALPWIPMQSLVPLVPRLLVVDDEPALRQMLEILFRREGHEVTAAPGKKAALEAIAQSLQPFPVVLTDLAMPDGSGLEVLAAAKARSPSTEVILITAHSTIENAIAAMRSGAYDFVAKPFDPSELAAL